MYSLQRGHGCETVQSALVHSPSVNVVRRPPVERRTENQKRTQKAGCGVVAIASCSVQVISRGKGRSAVAAAAYRSGQAIRNEYDGLSHDYTRRTGIVYTAILAPQGAPEWVYDRPQLWNRAELIERRGDARLAREVMIALPLELSRRQNIELATAYAQTFVHQGMIADMSIHDSGDGNPHAHLMLTTRPLDGNEFSKKKNRDWDSKDNLI